MNWFLGLAVGAILLIGACAMTVGFVIQTGLDTVESGIRAFCYETGWYDGAYGLEKYLSLPEDSGAECRHLYSDAYTDGWSGNYDPPE